jgi:hypothetical protein
MINIIIVFICAFLVDCGRTIRHRRIKNDSGRDPVKRRGIPESNNKIASAYISHCEASALHTFFQKP